MEFSFGALLNDPNKLNELAMMANPFPIAQNMQSSAAMSPQAAVAPYASSQDAFGRMLGMPDPGFAPGSMPGVTKPGAAPLTPQQMALLQNMMKAPDSRFLGSAGVGGRPGQVNLQPVSPTGTTSPVRPVQTLSQLIGR